MPNKLIPHFIAAICLSAASNLATAGLFDSLVEKAGSAVLSAAGELVGNKRKYSDGGSIDLSQAVALLGSKSPSKRFVVDELLAITGPNVPPDKSIYQDLKLGDAVEFDKLICKKRVESLIKSVAKSDFEFGKGDLIADKIEIKLSHCRFQETKEELKSALDTLVIVAIGKHKTGTSQQERMAIGAILGKLADMYYDLQDFNAAITTGGLAIELLGDTSDGILDKISAAVVVANSNIALENYQAADDGLSSFFNTHRTQIERPGIAAGLFRMGDVYQRLGYLGKAEYLYRVSNSTIDSAMSGRMTATSAGTLISIFSEIEGLQCSLADPIKFKAGYHSSNGYLCDRPISGVLQSKVRAAELMVRLAKTRELTSFYDYDFSPSLHKKPVEGWLLSTNPKKIRAHRQFAELIYKTGDKNRALVAFDALTDDLISFTEFEAAQSIISDVASRTHQEFSAYLTRFLLIAIQAGDPIYQDKALGKWLAYKGVWANQQRAVNKELERFKYRSVAKAMVDAERARTELRHALLNDESRDDADELIKKMGDSVNRIFEAQEPLRESLVDTVRNASNLKRVSSEIINKLKKQLGANDALVDFAKASNDEGKSVYIATIFFNGKNPVFQILPSVDIDEAVTNLQSLVRNSIADDKLPPKVEIDIVTRGLFVNLVHPLFDPLNDVRVLYISPDSTLSAYPFEITSNGKDGYPLADGDLRYVAAPRDLLNSARPSSGKKVLVFANPAYAGQVPPAKGAKRFVGRGLQFPPLEDTELEATFIGGIAKKSNATSVVKLGVNASKIAVLDDAPKSNILHFATHGFYLSLDSQDKIGSGSISHLIADSNPMWRAGLAFSGANSDPKNGILYASEVASSDLNVADLVVLSACDTGAGTLTASEGVIGLTRAFMVAGASTVVSSKWPVSSEEAISFMEYFYEDYFANFKAGSAFKNARIQLMKKHANPYLWGAFTLNASSVGGY